jgi:hypothetical protein
MMSKYKTLTKVCETNRLHWNRSLMPNMLAIYRPISLNTICHIAEEIQHLTLRQRMELLSIGGTISSAISRDDETIAPNLLRHSAGERRNQTRRAHAAPRPQNVVNLMDALRRSIAEEKRSPTKKGRKRIAGQTEMLLPIPGKKAKETAASKPVARPSTRQKKAG